MRHIILTLTIICIGLSSCTQAPLNVGSYNIRYDNPGDVQQGNAWTKRVGPICEFLQFENWDIFGAQEVLHHQLADLTASLSNYDYIGVGRDNGKEEGEYAPIFYKKDRIECLEKGWFWLSETPDVPGSRGWDAACNRICTWGKFEDKANKCKFWFFNLHLDHEGKVARTEGAKLVLSKIQELCGESPFILTGDFNSDQRDEAYGILTGSGMLFDTYETSQQRYATTGTTNWYKPEVYNDSRIDHVFVSKHFTACRYTIKNCFYWDETPEGIKGERRMLSDHYPVDVEVELPTGYLL